MIQLSEDTILIAHNDGTSAPFELRDLQTALIQACIASGETESWISGDIALSIEYALLTENVHVIAQSDLDDMVVRVLEDSGYPQTAAEYERSRPETEPAMPPVSFDCIQKVIAPNIADSSKLALKVEEALHLLGFEKASPKLMLELARHYRAAGKINPPAVVTPKKNLKTLSPILFSKEEILRALSGESAELVQNGVLRVHSVSRLFPAVRIDLFLAVYSDSCGLSKPVTELAFWPHSERLAGAVNEICAVIAGKVEKPPFYLQVMDADFFASEYMNAPKPCVSALLAEFKPALKHPLFRLSL